MEKKLNLTPYFATGASNILLGFPTIGKSTLAKNYENVVEIKSYEYQKKGLGWEGVYVNEVADIARFEPDTLFLIDISADIVKALSIQGICFNIISYLSHPHLKKHCIQKAIARGSDINFIAELEENFDKWFEAIDTALLPFGCKKIKIPYDFYLSEYMEGLSNN